MSTSFKAPNNTFQAGGQITGARFVTLSDSFVVSQSATGDTPIGVSMLGNKAFNLSYLAAAGDPVGVFSEGQYCLLELGSGGTTYGTKLKPSATGTGISVTGSEAFGAVALQSGSSGDLIRVEVRIS